jgi:hypothetical protein
VEPCGNPTFYALHVHRKDGSLQRHVMRGELPKVGDTFPATLAGEKVSAKVGTVIDPTRSLGMAVEPSSRLTLTKSERRFPPPWSVEERR